jgi:hypothetical protein
MGVVMPRETDGFGAVEYGALLEAELDAVRELAESGASIRRNKRLVVVVTESTMERLRLLAGRFLREGEYDRASKSGLANWLICRALPELEREMGGHNGHG